MKLSVVMTYHDLNGARWPLLEKTWATIKEQQETIELLQAGIAGISTEAELSLEGDGNDVLIDDPNEIY